MWQIRLRFCYRQEEQPSSSFVCLFLFCTPQIGALLRLSTTGKKLFFPFFFCCCWLLGSGKLPRTVDQLLILSVVVVLAGASLDVRQQEEEEQQPPPPPPIFDGTTVVPMYTCIRIPYFLGNIHRCEQIVVSEACLGGLTPSYVQYQHFFTFFFPEITFVFFFLFYLR